MESIKRYGKPKDLVPILFELNQEKDYLIEIKEPAQKRSLQQNRLLWKLIHEIAKLTGHDDNEVYCSLLVKANAKCDYVITAVEMEDALRKSFRGVQFVRMQEVNHKDCFIYRVFLGSSKMNTKEMNELLEATKRLAISLGIALAEYEDGLF